MPRYPPPPGFPPEPVSTPAPAAALAARRVAWPAWPPWFAFAALAAGLGVTVVIGIVVVVVAAAFGVSPEDDLPPGITIALTLVQNLSLVGAAFAFARLSTPLAARDFGLRGCRFWLSVRLLVVVWLGFLALSAAWAAVVHLDETQTLPDELGADGPLLNVLVVVVLITVLAPLGEELFFRGFFFAALRNWRGPWSAAVITGLVFGGIHVGSSPLGYLVPLAIFGFGLCLLYELTGSLYPPIALHALNNSIALGAALHWDWQIPVMMVGSTAGALACAWLLARAIGNRRTPTPASAPAPDTG